MNPNLPHDVSAELVIDALEEAGYDYILLPDPAPTSPSTPRHARHTAEPEPAPRSDDQPTRIASMHWPNHTLMLTFSADHPRYLLAEATIDGNLDLSDINTLTKAVDAWNSERVGPTAYISISDDATIHIKLGTSLATACRASKSQLVGFIRTAAESTLLAVENFTTEFPELLENHYPSDITLERIRDGFSDIGIEKTHDGDNMILAWINEILIGAFVEPGPSMLIKGHWEANLNPDKDYIRAALVCNKWNEDHPETKAFCHIDADGLQIRVEYIAHADAGLTQAQLVFNLQLAIHHILNGIDHISTEISGSCAVGWP